MRKLVLGCAALCVFACAPKSAQTIQAQVIDGEETISVPAFGNGESAPFHLAGGTYAVVVTGMTGCHENISFYIDASSTNRELGVVEDGTPTQPITARHLEKGMYRMALETTGAGCTAQVQLQHQ